jgi:hypothetical protein
MADENTNPRTVPKTCQNCSHWFATRAYGPVDPVTKKRPLQQVHDFGACERFKSHMIEIDGKTDEIECPMSQTDGGPGGGQVGGYVCTGKDFGCIHFRAKADEKGGWTQGGEEPVQTAPAKACPATVKFQGEVLHCQDPKGEGHTGCHFNGHLNWNDKSSR